MARSDRFGKDLMMGMVYGKRKRGRPKTRYSDNIRELTGMSMAQVVRKAQDRFIWRRFVWDALADQLRGK